MCSIGSIFKQQFQQLYYIMGDTEGPPLSNDEAQKLCQEPPSETKDFFFQQTMYRIKDPKRSLQFYTEVLGMRLLQKLDFPSMKFTLYFMGFESPEDFVDELGSKPRTEWMASRKATLELTHNWGTENDPDFKYHNGNSDPRGFGHIGLVVPDVYKACERFEKLGVNFVKKPDAGKMKGIAFIQDPDGYWIEILNNKTMPVPEGPKERRFQDGKCEVTFPDGMFQTVFPDGNQEVVYPDGSRLQIKTDGEKILHLPNGQREIQTKEHKRREYPDGTVKILYPDGSQETRYSNGRVRMKDPQGHLIMDTHQPQT